MKRNIFILIIIGIFLISLYIFLTQFFFYYDMARDAFNSYEIWHDHHLKVLGPPTDISGVFHGVLWYYFLAIFYALGKGNPLFPGFVIMVLSFISAIPLKKLLSEFTNNESISWTGVILYLCCPLFQFYAHWLSNPWLSFFIAPFIVYWLWKIKEVKNSKYSILVGIGYGLLIQSDFAYLLCLISLPFYFLFFNKKVRVVNFLFIFIGLLFTLSSFVIADIKFKGQTAKSLLQYFTTGHEGKFNIGSLAEVLFHKLMDFLNLSVLPIQEVGIIAILVLFVVFLFYKKIKLDQAKLIFLSIWVLQLFIFFIFSTGISNSKFVFGPFLSTLVVLVTYLFSKAFSQKIIFIVVALIAVLQSYSIYSAYKIEYLPLTVQHGMTYQNATKAVDYTYTAAQKGPFTITSLTNPLFINTTWAYLYQIYGENTYGYVPYWHGRGQVGQLGSLPEKNFATDLRFLIIEPTTGIPQNYIDKIEYDENKLSDITDQKQFGTIVIQKRIFHPNKPVPQTPDSLINSALLNE